MILDDIDDDGGDDKFEDAVDGGDTEQLKLKQRSFEFKFKVDTLKGSLYRSDPDRRKPDTLLVELVAERFGLEFYTRPYDMAAEVFLGSVTVDDFVDNPRQNSNPLYLLGTTKICRPAVAWYMSNTSG